MTYCQRKKINTQIGEFQPEGTDSWLCYYEYENRDFTLIVSDDDGKPSPTQISTLLQILPRLSDYEAKCRDSISGIEDHDFDGVFLDCEFDFKFTFSWGNGEWGTTVFIDFLNDEIVNSYRVSD